MNIHSDKLNGIIFQEDLVQHGWIVIVDAVGIL